jgi:peptide/nickel transport system permease protein
MGRHMLGRLLAVLPILFVVSFVAFMLLALNPVDPAEQLVGPTATDAQIDARRHELGLDQPLMARYGDWLGDAVHGDLGRSVYTTAPVTSSLKDRAGVTLSLTLGGLLVAVAIGVPLGVAAALRAGRRTDRLVTAGSTLGQAIPSFWLGTILVLVFAERWEVFNAVFYVSPGESIVGWLKSITLPSIALGATGAAWIARHTRSELVTVLEQDYIQTALAKGASRRQVLFGHAARNAAPPLLTVIAVLVSMLLGASLVIERVFALPGLGSLALEAITRNDPAPLLGFVLCAVLIVVIVNVLLDIAHALLDPRVHRS